MRIALAVASVLVLLGTGCVERVPEDAAGNDASSVPAVAMYKSAPATPALSCTIYGGGTCELGSVPKVTVAITNQTDAGIYLVGSLDGSGWKGRYPHCYFEVTGPDGKSAVPEIILEDPFCSPLREKDFVKVLPGEMFDPYDQSAGFFPALQLDPFVFRTPGAYRVRFVYSTMSDSIALWRNGGWEGVPADERPKILALFARVPKLEVRSNELTVTVVAVGK